MNVLTFDLEDWFHYDMVSDAGTWDSYGSKVEEDTDRILEFLESKELTATFFCLGWIAERYPSLVRNIADAGHEIGCHSFHHRMVHQMTREAFRNDTETALKTIEDILGKKIIYYRAPAFSITASCVWAFEVLAELGIELDSSIMAARHDYGGFPEFGHGDPVLIHYNRSVIKELPINTTRFLTRDVVFSGGGFFRLMPYLFIARRSKEAGYVMTYFHPRDFNPGVPRLSHLPLKRRIKSTVGLKAAFRKFQRYMEDFDFVSVSQCDRLIDWGNVKKVQL